MELLPEIREGWRGPSLAGLVFGKDPVKNLRSYPRQKFYSGRDRKNTSRDRWARSREALAREWWGGSLETGLSHIHLGGVG